MHIVRNERRIHILTSVAKSATLAGLGALLIGLIISFVRPGWFVPMLVSVALGFALSIAGGYFTDRYAGPFAHHDALAEMLKGLDYHHVLLQYVLPASHVLLEASGCTVFVVKTQGGQVSYENGEDGKWRHRERGTFFRRIMGQAGVGAPHTKAQRQIRKLEHYLDSRLPDAEVPVRAAIVFVNPDVTLEADASPVPAFYRKKVKAWLRGPGELKSLPPDLHRRLAKALGVGQLDAQEGR